MCRDWFSMSVKYDAPFRASTTLEARWRATLFPLDDYAFAA